MGAIPIWVPSSSVREHIHAMATISVTISDDDLARIASGLKQFKHNADGVESMTDVPTLAAMLLSEAAEGLEFPGSWEDTNLCHVLRERGYTKRNAQQEMHPGVAMRLSEDWFERTLSFTKFVVAGAAISVLLEVGYGYVADKLLFAGSLALSFYFVAFALAALGYWAATVSHLLRFSPAYKGKLLNIPPYVRESIIWLSTKSYELSFYALWVWLAGIVIRVLVLLGRIGTQGFGS